MTIRIFEALPSQTRGREIARTEQLGDAQSIAINMGKVYTEFLYTVEVDVITTGTIAMGRITTYKAGKLVTDDFTAHCAECGERIKRDLTKVTPQYWIHSTTGERFATTDGEQHAAAPEER